MKNPAVSLGRCSPWNNEHRRQHRRKDDVIGGLVFLLILVNGVFVFAALHRSPLSIFNDGKQTILFMLSVFLMIGGLAVLRWLGPRCFPLRFLMGSSVRAMILRQFLPVAAAAALTFDVLNVSSYGRTNLVLSSFLVLQIGRASCRERV